MELGISTNEILISILSGILVALAVEAVHHFRQKIRKSNEIKYIREFFLNGQKEIREDINIPQVHSAQARFVRFKAMLRDFRNVAETHSTNLKSNEKFELFKHIDETINFMNWLPAAPADLKPYNMFFEKIQKITWLGFKDDSNGKKRGGDAQK